MNNGKDFYSLLIGKYFFSHSWQPLNFHFAVNENLFNTYFNFFIKSLIIGLLSVFNISTKWTNY